MGNLIIRISSISTFWSFGPDLILANNLFSIFFIKLTDCIDERFNKFMEVLCCSALSTVTQVFYSQCVIWNTLQNIVCWMHHTNEFYPLRQFLHWPPACGRNWINSRTIVPDSFSITYERHGHAPVRSGAQPFARYKSYGCRSSIIRRDCWIRKASLRESSSVRPLQEVRDRKELDVRNLLLCRRCPSLISCHWSLTGIFPEIRYGRGEIILCI